MMKGRVEAFSDGVFAVAITLLVLDLHVPGADRGVIAGLADEWSSFAAFGISFLIIAIIWVNHHAVLGIATRVDRGFAFINFTLLLPVVLVPFTTSLFATGLVRGGSQSSVAAALFSANSLLMGVGFQLIYQWIHRRGLAVTELDPAAARRAFVRFGSGLAVYAACIGISFVSAVAVLCLHFAVAAFYIADRSEVR